MAERSLRGENSRAGEPFADQIIAFRGRYNTLQNVLGQFATEVERKRVTERDPDINPYSFIRNARHVFVAPPQEVELTETEHHGELTGTAPYTLFRDELAAEFNEARVRTTITLAYDDAGNIPTLSVSDTGEELPVEIQAVLDEAVQPLVTKA